MRFLSKFPKLKLRSKQQPPQSLLIRSTTTTGYYYSPIILHLSHCYSTTTGNNGSKKSIRIGCASGFWGDTPTAAVQLVRGGNLDYLMLDYLSEITMSLLVAAQRKNPDLGWCPDFAQSMALLLPQVKKQGLKVITNAGGVNPASCMKVIQQLAEKSNVSFKIALVTGDDVLSSKSNLTKEQCPDPTSVTSANAYLGAGPIARALDLGADIVITGRCTDSALALGPLVHHFKWPWDNFNLMATGSLVGHLIECGAQSTGGIFTDWEKVPGWENNGFPIAVCEADGNFTITKPEGTGGLVSRGTVSEQLLYEIDNPRAYLLPDVVCNLSQVKMTETIDGVSVTGATGLPPTSFYKVGKPTFYEYHLKVDLKGKCCVGGTYQDGWRLIGVCPIVGPKARLKGHKTVEAILNRCRGIYSFLNMPDFTRAFVQVLGTEEAYGKNARQENLDTRDAVMWFGVQHSEKRALEILAKEIASAGTGMAPGLTAVIGGRPKPAPLLHFFSYLWPKDQLPITIKLSDGYEEVYKPPNLSTSSLEDIKAACDLLSQEECLNSPKVTTGSHTYKLSELAWTRSGDKGDNCNIGVISRDPSYYPYLLASLTNERIMQYFSHKFTSNSPTVRRYELPGVNGINFVLENSLGGGGIASLNADPQGKGYGQMLADITIENVPKLK